RQPRPCWIWSELPLPSQCRPWPGKAGPDERRAAGLDSKLQLEEQPVEFPIADPRDFPEHPVRGDVPCQDSSRHLERNGRSERICREDRAFVWSALWVPHRRLVANHW